MKPQSWTWLFLSLSLLPFQQPSDAATITWTNTVGGNWSVASNWQPNQVPGAGDDVMLTTSGGYTVTADISATVKSVTLANGTLTFRVLNNLTVSITNGLNFSAGVINGPGGLMLGGSNSWSGGMFNSASYFTVTAGASLGILGAADHDFSGVVVTNNGTIFHDGGHGIEGSDRETEGLGSSRCLRVSAEIPPTLPSPAKQSPFARC